MVDREDVHLGGGVRGTLCGAVQPKSSEPSEVTCKVCGAYLESIGQRPATAATAVTRKAYKAGTVFFYWPPEGRVVEMVVISTAGPLCVGRVYDHRSGEMVVGLYWIYIRKYGAHFGPFFADIGLADRAMKKIVAQFGKMFFEQPLEWIARQTALQAWVDKNIGKSGDLIGGEWEKSKDEGQAAP